MVKIIVSSKNMSKTPIGNVKGFSKEMGTNLLYVLGLGYMGGSISAMGKQTEELFPYRLDGLPYTGRISYGRDTGLLEYLFPMKSLGFPYTTLMRLNASDGIFTPYMAWLLDISRLAFAMTRQVLAITSNTGERAARCWPGDLFRFYLMPFIFIGLLSPLSLIIFIMTVILSTQASEGKGFMYTFAPATLGWVGLAGCGKYLNIMCILLSGIYCFAGFLSLMISIPAYCIITASIVTYLCIVFFFSPFLYNNGLWSTFHEMKRHKFGLTLIFMTYTLISANQYLTPEATLGLALGALYVLYSLR